MCARVCVYVLYIVYLSPSTSVSIMTKEGERLGGEGGRERERLGGREGGDERGEGSLQLVFPLGENNWCTFP